MQHAFGRSLTLGVEEELFLVDRTTMALRSGASLIVGHPPTTGLKYELFECLVETATPVCESVEEVAEVLPRQRREVADRAAPSPSSRRRSASASTQRRCTRSAAEPTRRSSPSRATGR